MTRWAIAITPTRMEFFHWFSLLIVNGLCLLTNFLFWVFAFMFLKTLLTWNGLVPLITFFWRLRPWWLGGAGFLAFGEAWADVFTEADFLNAYSLQLILHETGQVGAAVLGMLTVPILAGNPIFWMIAMLTTFISHSILSFIYRYLTESDRGRVRTWRH